ncbi:MAG TPA: TlpA disulfide reductase family protein [Polyangia bacterium]|jgi:thiol-disulfide isomerase/thioredoxin|nr:TlpA disulfide reductase family protein [Polyangia bacterium]
MDQGRHSRLIAALAVVLLASCATAGGGGSSSSASETGHQVGAAVPEIKVDSLAGKTIDVASYRGRVLLLDVWASWCGPCKQELPMLDAMARRLKAQGIDVLAVSVDQDRANVDKFLKGHGRWSLTIAHDPAGAIAERLQPDKMPTSYVIDRSGIVRYVNAGFVPDDAAVIEKRLLEVAGQ